MGFYELVEDVFMQRQKSKDFMMLIQETKKCLAEITHQE
jgi:hypothetical protein